MSAEVDASDHALAAELATGAGRPAARTTAPPRRRRRPRRGQGRGRRRIARLAGRAVATAPPQRRRVVRRSHGGSRPGPRGAALDHRPARRHPRVRRDRAQRLGGARGAGGQAANRLPGPWRCPDGPHPSHRRAAERARTTVGRAPVVVVSRTRPPAAATGRARRAGRRAVADGFGRAPRRWPWCAAKRTCTCTPAASTSGTLRRPSPSPSSAGLHCSPSGRLAFGLRPGVDVAARPRDRAPGTGRGNTRGRRARTSRPQ